MVHYGDKCLLSSKASPPPNLGLLPLSQESLCFWLLHASQRCTLQARKQCSSKKNPWQNADSLKENSAKGRGELNYHQVFPLPSEAKHP